MPASDEVTLGLAITERLGRTRGNQRRTRPADAALSRTGAIARRPTLSRSGCAKPA